MRLALVGLLALVLVVGASAAAKPLDVVTAKLPSTNTDDLYDVHLKATGGTPPYTWSLAKGTLPRALKLGASGELKGYPQNDGTWGFTVRVRDEKGKASTQALSITVADPTPAPPQIWWSYGNSFYPKLIPIPLYAGNAVTIPIHAYKGTPPFTWALAAAPPGLSMDAASGEISGTPTTTGSYTSTLTVTDSKGRVGTQVILFGVFSGPNPTVTTLPDGKVGQPYSYALSTCCGDGTVTFSLGGGSLPPGLSLGSDGVISGTPTTPGRWDIGVHASDVDGHNGGGTVTITIAP